MEILKLFSPKTLEDDTPLILAFGREINGNHSDSLIKDIGYCCDKNSSTFWSRVECLAARQAGLKTLRPLINKKNKSPICFANCLATVIPNNYTSAQKARIRSDVCEEKVIEGINNVFEVLDKYELIQRIEVCIISYQKHANNELSPFTEQEGKLAFDTAVKQIGLSLSSHEIEIENVPYLLGSPKNEFIDGTLTQSGKDRIQTIIHSWLGEKSIN